jgi:hypothetical protein
MPAAADGGPDGSLGQLDARPFFADCLFDGNTGAGDDGCLTVCAPQIGSFAAGANFNSLVFDTENQRK